MKTENPKLKHQVKKRHRRITDVEKAIATIKKFEQGPKTSVFITDNTVIIRRADYHSKTTQGSVLRGLTTSNETTKNLRSVYEGMRYIINASNVETEKAISTLRREQTDSDREFFSRITAKAMTLK